MGKTFLALAAVFGAVFQLQGCGDSTTTETTAAVGQRHQQQQLDAHARGRGAPCLNLRTVWGACVHYTLLTTEACGRLCLCAHVSGSGRDAFGVMCVQFAGGKAFDAPSAKGTHGETLLLF